MKERLNAINANLNSAIAAMHDLHTELVAKANSQKRTLIELLKDMAQTRSTMTTLGEMCSAAGANLLDIGEFCSDMSDKIGDTLSVINDIPVGLYETFVGFCDQCGKEIHETDLYYEKTSDGLHCANCVHGATVVVD